MGYYTWNYLFYCFSFKSIVVHGGVYQIETNFYYCNFRLLNLRVRILLNIILQEMLRTNYSMCRKCTFISMQKGQSNWNQIFSYISKSVILVQILFPIVFTTECIMHLVEHYYFFLEQKFCFLYFFLLRIIEFWCTVIFLSFNSCEWHKRDCLGTHVGRRWQSLFIFNKLHWLYQDIWPFVYVSSKYNLAIGVFYLYLNNNENSLKQYFIVSKIYHIVTGGQWNAKCRFFIIIENF